MPPARLVTARHPDVSVPRAGARHQRSIGGGHERAGRWPGSGEALHGGGTPHVGSLVRRHHSHRVAACDVTVAGFVGWRQRHRRHQAQEHTVEGTQHADAGEDGDVVVG